MASNKLDNPTARRRKRIGVGLVVVIAAVLIAIGVARSGSQKVLNANADTLVLVGKSSDEAGEAMGRGELTDVGGCLGWAGEAGEAVVIWPHGTHVVTPDPLRVNIDGKTYELGDTVEIGGGSSGPLESSSYFYDQVPDACRTAPVFVANAG